MSYETQQQNEAVKPTKIDLNDPTAVLPDDELIMDPEGDAFAGLAPIPDGTYLTALSVSTGSGVKSGRTEQGAYSIVGIQLKVTDEGDKFNERVFFDDATSFIDSGTGVSRMAGIYKALGETIPARVGLSDFTRLFVAALEGNPLVKVTTQWIAKCTVCTRNNGKKGKIMLRGMRKFPQLDNGTYKHTVDCPECGTLLTAQAKPTKYAPKG